MRLKIDIVNLIARNELLQGLLGANLVGFQVKIYTYTDRNVVYFNAKKKTHSFPFFFSS